MKKIISYTIIAIFVTACGSSTSEKKVDTPTESSQSDIIETGPTPTTPASSTPEITMLFNGAEWQGAGFYASHLYYAKGLTGMYNEQPHLMLSFKGIKTPDDRQLSLSLIGFTGATGKFTREKLAAGFTGSATGDATNPDMFSNKSFDTYSDLSVEITGYSVINKDEAEVDGMVSGSFTKENTKIENGKFTGVKVKVFNEKY